MALYRNKTTGVVWDFEGEMLKRIKADEEFEPFEPVEKPKAKQKKAEAEAEDE